MNNTNTNTSNTTDITIDQHNDLYKILELDHNASLTEIKKQFRKLALKYHPDKNSDTNACEKFNQIRIAYDVLSNKEKKEKYDKMIEPKKKQFTDTIFLFLKQITNPKNIHNLMNNPEIANELSSGDVNLIAQKLIQKILNDIDINIDVIELTNIFIKCSSNQTQLNQPQSNQHQQNQNKLPNPMEKNDSPSIESFSQTYETSDFNTLNIFGEIKISLDDIYHNRLKEIIIKRKIYNKNNTTIETNKYFIPLYDQQVEITGAGDKIISENKTEAGNVILKVYCKKDKNKKISRNGYDIIYNDNITLYELFNGFTKNITYFDSTIEIISLKPFEEYNFDGNKVTIMIPNKGLPCDQEGTRGNLIIKCILIKNKNFNDLLKQHFN
jgi:curved DNA-binding protein CbpA